MYSEDDLVMISALQHLLFCPRQCALIHIEQQWTENLFTAEGRILHERVHTAAKESRRTIKVEFDVPLRSLQLGIIGRADIVEFHLQDDKQWLPFPVEYKRGKAKKNSSDKVQLCAQAICLEEMLNTKVPAGALYYGKKKRRMEIVFDQALRQETITTSDRLRSLIESGVTPEPQHSPDCKSCSFVDTCLPQTMGKKNNVEKYMEKILSP